MPVIETQVVHHGHVQLATQAFGCATDPAIVLIMGATASMLGWPDELCSALAAQGLYVIRFDHRDTGRSTTVAPGEAAYSVEDMADDVVAVIDVYGLPQAHLLGMSLGAYIAQIVALEHPERIRTLTLVSAEPLGWDGAELPTISEAILGHFARLDVVDWSDANEAAAFLLELERLNAGPGGSFDAGRASDRIKEILGRTTSPSSSFNHASLTTAKDWTGRYRDIAQPMLVIHGDHDPVLPLENGHAIAAAVADARMLVLPGVGHELPLSQLDLIARQVAANCSRASVSP